MNITDALKLIITRSPNASANAMTALRAAQNNSPVINKRYAICLELALNDPQAEFTPQERADLVSLLDGAGTSSRTVMIAVRLTQAEYETVREQAGEQSIADYVRDRIL